jgi:hypothetical protein
MRRAIRGRKVTSKRDDQTRSTTAAWKRPRRRSLGMRVAIMAAHVAARGAFVNDIRWPGTTGTLGLSVNRLR